MDLHRTAISILKQIRHIKKELAYAERRASGDAKIWLVKGMVPGWEADVTRLKKAYESRVAQYAMIQIELAEPVRVELSPILSEMMIPVYRSNRLKAQIAGV